MQRSFLKVNMLIRLACIDVGRRGLRHSYSALFACSRRMFALGQVGLGNRECSTFSLMTKIHHVHFQRRHSGIIDVKRIYMQPITPSNPTLRFNDCLITEKLCCSLGCSLARLPFPASLLLTVHYLLENFCHLDYKTS